MPIPYRFSGNGTLPYPGDGFFIDCRQYHHYYTAGEKWVHSDLHFIGPQAEYHFREFYQDGGPIFHEPKNSQYQSLLEILLRIWDTFQSYRSLQVSNYISNILSVLLVNKYRKGTENSTPQTIGRLLRFIESNYTDHLTLDRLAAEVSLSKYHLSREFKKYTGISPVNYVILHGSKMQRRFSGTQKCPSGWSPQRSALRTSTILPISSADIPGLPPAHTGKRKRLYLWDILPDEFRQYITGWELCYSNTLL